MCSFFLVELEFTLHCGVVRSKYFIYCLMRMLLWFLFSFDSIDSTVVAQG